MRAKRKSVFFSAAILALTALPTWGQQPASAQPTALQGVGIDQRMGQQVSGDLVFRDEAGKSVRFGDYFGSKPIVLSLVYYNCPFMCTEVLNGELRALQGIPLQLGKDFEAVTVSFDPKETTGDAEVKHRIFTGLYGHPSSAGGWHFLTGDQASIQALTEAVGFHYAYDAPSGQFAHATGIIILTPQGRVARYYYGLQYPTRDVRLGMVEASNGKIGSPTDAALLFCYHYDPLTGKYGLVVSNVIRIGGILTTLALAIFLGLMFRHEKYEIIAPPAVPSAAMRGRKT